MPDEKISQDFRLQKWVQVAFQLLAGMPMICEFCRRIKIFVITASSKNSKPTLKKKKKG